MSFLLRKKKNLKHSLFSVSCQDGLLSLFLSFASFIDSRAAVAAAFSSLKCNSFSPPQSQPAAVVECSFRSINTKFFFSSFPLAFLKQKKFNASQGNWREQLNWKTVTSFLSIAVAPTDEFYRSALSSLSESIHLCLAFCHIDLSHRKLDATNDGNSRIRHF